MMDYIIYADHVTVKILARNLPKTREDKSTTPASHTVQTQDGLWELLKWQYISVVYS